MCQITPDQLYKMTPEEFRKKADAMQKQKRNDLKWLAWQTAQLMNSTGNYKETIRPNDLISED